MKIGYPCINRTLDCSAARTFRLASYSEERMHDTIAGNLACLQRILEFNVAHDLRFFRISSDTIPFASHPDCPYPWQEVFAEQLAFIGAYIRQQGLRISMHPDQFVLLNALEERIVANSVEELAYHADLLDLMELDTTAKIQIHVGGVYGDKPASTARFVARFLDLPERIRRRLVIENDDRLFSLQDTLALAAQTSIPVLFDCFHHELKQTGEPVDEALKLAGATWGEADGTPMMDYSTQAPGKRTGTHAESIHPDHFRGFLDAIAGIDVDIMLEIKDKEPSALEAVAVAKALGYV